MDGRPLAGTARIGENLRGAAPGLRRR